jgi:phage tail-like protein
MGIPSDPLIYRLKNKFSVSIEGVGTSEFQSVTGVRKEIAPIEFRAGGRNLATKIPGNVTIPPVQMSIGKTQDFTLYQWFREVADLRRELGSGQPDGAFTRTVDIVQYGNGGGVLDRYRLFQAWPSLFDAGEWDATSDEVLITQIELQIYNWEPLGLDFV